MLTTDGLSQIVNIFCYTSTPTDDYQLSFGDNATAESASDTDLGNELEAITTVTIQKQSYLQPYDTVLIRGISSPQTSAITVREIGLWASDGTLLAREVLPAEKPIAIGASVCVLLWLTLYDAGGHTSC
jgi:hypothetical protein